LLDRIVEGRGGAGRGRSVARYAAPLMAFDIAAPARIAARATEIRFDLAAFFAARLAGERPFLFRETHLIASRYGWSRAEIMALHAATDAPTRR
jgi:hypothetical protein